MYEIILTSKEKAQLEHHHRTTKDVQELDRIKAVLLRSEGWSVQALRVQESTITRHINDYLQELKDPLILKNAFKGERGQCIFMMKNSMVKV